MSENEKNFEELLSEIESLRLENEELHKHYKGEIEKLKAIEQQNYIKNKALDTSINAIAISDLTGKLTYINPAFLELWGYNNSEQVLGRDAVEFWELRESAEVVKYTLLTKGRWSGMLTALVSNNINRDFYVNSTLIKSDDGVPICLMAAFVDLTDRINFENELKNTNEFLEKLINYANAPIIVWDNEFKITRFNNSFCHLTGYSEEEMLGKNIHSLLPTQSSDSTIELIKLANQGENWDSVEITVKCKDGNLRTVLWNSASIYKDDHSVMTIAQGQDITERKSIETALQDSKKLYDELAMQSKTVYWEIDINGLYTSVGDNVKDIWGYSPDELVNKLYFYDITTDIDRETLKEVGFDLIRSGKPIYSFENVIKKKNGEEIWVMTSGVPIFDDSGNLKGYKGNDTDITRLKETEKALRDSETKYRLLTELASDVIWVLNLNQQKFTYISPAIYRLRGITPEQALSESLQDALTPESQIAVKNAIEQYLPEFLANPATDSYYMNEIQQPHADGRLVWVEVSTKYRFNDAGEIEVIGVSRAIDERKNLEIEREKAKNELEKTNAYLQNLLNYANAPIIVWDNYFRITRFNTAFEHLTGLSEKDVLGKSLKILFPESKVLQSMELIKQAQSGERWESVEIEIQNMDGSIRTVLWNSATIYENDNPIATIAQGQDITERKFAEKSLKESEAKLRAVFNVANIGITILDKNGNYIYFNDFWSNSLQYKPEELDNKTFFELTYIEDLKDAEQIYSQFVKKEILTARLERRYVKKDGSILWTDVSSAVILDDKGNFENVLNMLVDITSKKIDEEKLRSYSIELELINNQLTESKELIESNLAQKNELISQLENAKIALESSIKEKDKFFSIIAHDLRSPLGGFRNIITLLHESPEEFTEDERRSVIATIKDSADRLYGFLENLLEWSRSQRGVIKYNPTDIFLYNTIVSILNLHQNIADAKQITFVKSVPKLFEVYADITMLNTILRNLISNAVKFTNVGGMIEVGANLLPDGKTAEIFVRDNGIGISQNRLNRIFSIDDNISTEGTSGEKGSGLGLVLCREFVEKCGGILRVESLPDSGTTFYFTLPVNK